MQTINISRDSLSDVLTTLYDECASIGATFKTDPLSDEIIVKLPNKEIKIKIYDIVDAYDISRELFSKK